tara:strand:- start:23810 stop:24415 length:606 start_codon:yes stop_codon:yes gene_type:complete
MKINNNFLDLGYTVVDDFLPIEIANELNALYDNETHWQPISQERPNHYKHVFKFNCESHPHIDEVYSAKFNRSDNLEKTNRIVEIFDTHFKSKIKDVSQLELTDFDMRCMCLNRGDYYRTHTDDYAGKVNVIYYVNKKWIWDWGGILHVGSVNDDEFIKPILPKFNRCVFLYNEKFRSPHFVNAVANFAQNPRYSLVSFNK